MPTAGEWTRTLQCTICDRQFRGNPRTVNKLFKLHMKTHGQSVSNDPIQGECVYIAGTVKHGQKDQDY